MLNGYDKSNPIYDLDGWIVFYGNQAKNIENDTSKQQLFQASCETCDLLLELKETRAELDSKVALNQSLIEKHALDHQKLTLDNEALRAQVAQLTAKNYPTVESEEIRRQAVIAGLAPVEGPWTPPAEEKP